jgi:hypothetical protein
MKRVAIVYTKKMGQAACQMPSKSLSPGKNIGSFLKFDHSASELFDRGQRRSVILRDSSPNELILGRIGKFKGFGFAPYVIERNSFEDFNERGFSKVVTSFRLSFDARSTTLAAIEMRIHSNDPKSRSQARLYGALLSLAIHAHQRHLFKALRQRCLKAFVEPIITESEIHPSIDESNLI